MKAIDLFYFDAGGGHRSAANALKQVIERQKRPWDVRLVHLQNMMSSFDIFRQTNGNQERRRVQPGAAQGVDVRLPADGSADACALIRSYHSAASEDFAAPLRCERSGSGDFGDPELQSLAAPGFGGRGSDGDGFDGYGGLSAALLDGEAGSILYLWDREGGGAGAGARAPGGPRFPDVGDDLESTLLRPARSRPAGGAGAVGAGSGSAGGAGAIWRPRVDSDVRHREVPGSFPPERCS